MALMSVFSPDSMTTAQYEKAMKRLAAAGAGSPDGRVIHICYGDSPKLKIVTVWQSKDNFRFMAPKLLPILKDLGIEFGPPILHEVHDIQLGKSQD